MLYQGALVYSGTLYGMWKQGLAHKPTCNKHHHYLCCSQAENKQLHYVFTNEHLNTLNVHSEFGKTLRNRNIASIGDSLMEQFNKGIYEILNWTYSNEKIFTSKPQFTHSYFGTHPYNGSFSYYLAYTILLDGEEQNRKYFVSETLLNEIVQKNDIVILSFGIHYKHILPLQSFHQHVHSTAEIIKQLVRNKRKCVVFRSTLPQHFKSPLKTGFYEGRVV